MTRLLAAIFISTVCAGCASQQPSQAQLEYSAFERVIDDKFAKGKISYEEAQLAKQQYLGSLRTRESNIAASYGVANSNNTYAQNSSMAMGLALMCAGQRGGHC